MISAEIAFAGSKLVLVLLTERLPARTSAWGPPEEGAGLRLIVGVQETSWSPGGGIAQDRGPVWLRVRGCCHARHHPPPSGPEREAILGLLSPRLFVLLGIGSCQHPTPPATAALPGPGSLAHSQG